MSAESDILKYAQIEGISAWQFDSRNHGNSYSTGGNASPSHKGSTCDPAALLPWPSLGWQQAALAGAVVLGLITAVVGMTVTGEPGGLVAGMASMLAGLAFAGMAIYAGWSTSWLTGMSMASLPAKFAGVVTIGLITALALMLYAILWIVSTLSRGL